MTDSSDTHEALIIAPPGEAAACRLGRTKAEQRLARRVDAMMTSLQVAIESGHRNYLVCCVNLSSLVPGLTDAEASRIAAHVTREVVRWKRKRNISGPYYKGIECSRKAGLHFHLLISCPRNVAAHIRRYITILCLRAADTDSARRLPGGWIDWATTTFSSNQNGKIVRRSVGAAQAKGALKYILSGEVPAGTDIAGILGKEDQKPVSGRTLTAGGNRTFKGMIIKTGIKKLDWWQPSQFLGTISSLIVAAGDLLSSEFARPSGPRGSGDKANIDTEIEALLRPALLNLWPARYVGEETGLGGNLGAADCWLVDPHDGTRAFLQGYRGTAISIALLRNGQPALGVVYAPLPPDRGPDLIAWAEGMPSVLRNGVSVPKTLATAQLRAGALVFLNHESQSQPVINGKRVAPARFIAMPSIAYRLARVAAGDGIAAVSTSGPCGYDYAAGHALLIGAGGDFLNERGQPVTYTREGDSQVSRCFGGAPEATRLLASRNWGGGPRTKALSRPAPHLGWPRPPAGGPLDRAIGCLLGQVIGDSLGSLVEFRSAGSIAREYPDGVHNLADGGTWNTIAGQATDDTELALALARTLAAQEQFDLEAIAGAYGTWIASAPFDIGNTTRQGLGAAHRAKANKAGAAQIAANRGSQANGSLMRISPIGLWAASPEEAAEAATADSALSHPNPVCITACAAFAAAVFEGVQSGSRQAMLDVATRVALSGADGGVVAGALERAAQGQFPDDYQTNQGWVVVAFQNALAHLARGDAPEVALIATVGRGGDTDTNGAIAGALLGAAWGRDAFPDRWRLPVLACRPDAALDAPQPRPAVYWPDDIPVLAEALLARQRRHMAAALTEPASP